VEIAIGYFPSWGINRDGVNGRLYQLVWLQRKSRITGLLGDLVHWLQEGGIPWYMDFQKKYKESGLSVVAVDDDGWKSVKPFLAEQKVNCTMVIAKWDLWLANCYFAHNSLRFPALLPFFNASSGRPFHPLHRYPGPLARTRRCPFRSCGVASS